MRPQGRVPRTACGPVPHRPPSASDGPDSSPTITMANPKRRISRSRRNKKRAHLRLTPTQLVRCSNCGAAIKPHHVCAGCGHYRGRQVLVGETV